MEGHSPSRRGGVAHYSEVNPFVVDGDGGDSSAADADAADGDGRGELGVGRLAAELVPEEKRERGGEREREGEKREK